MKKSCKIFWSTQSGRAKACARRTARILREQTNVEIQDIGSAFDDEIATAASFIELAANLASGNNNNNNNNDNTFFLLFVSTTGDGEHCDSIKETWKMLLQKSLPKTLFDKQQFAMFCLGDRAYGPQFCAAGRKLAVRLLQLGMNRLCDVGYGDDNTPDGGVFRDLDDWLQEQLLPVLEDKKKETTNQTNNENIYINTNPIPYSVKIDKKTPNTEILSDGIAEWQSPEFESSYREYFTQFCPISAYNYDLQTQRIEFPTTITAAAPTSAKKGKKHAPLLGTVLSNDRITAPNWEQDTRHIQIQLTANNYNNNSNDKGESNVGNLPTTSTDTSKSIVPLPYQAGDIATILPFNSDEEVDKFLRVLPPETQALADDVLTISIDEDLMNNSFTRWPKMCTLRGWLKYCADIHSLPEREDLRALSFYCPISSSSSSHHDHHPAGKDQCEKLQSLSETSEAALYADYVLREKRSWADVLYDFDSLRAPSESGLSVSALLVLLPPMRPREFSIASAPSSCTTTTAATTATATISQSATAAAAATTADNTTTTATTNNSFTVELCVAVVEGKTRLGRMYHGLCSKFLSQIVPPTKHDTKENNVHNNIHPTALQVWIRPGSFGRLPMDLVPGQAKFQVPILCVGAGTGIAPMRSLLLERKMILTNSRQAIQQNNIDNNNDNSNNNNNENDNILVFGCRKQDMDYYYREEWEQLSSNNNNGNTNDHSFLRLLTAFSRDQFQKIYVQKVLREADHGTLIVKHILERNGAVYIAGGPKMARAVKEEIVQALGKELSSLSSVGEGGGEKAANQLLNKLQRLGKFSIEAWS